MTRPVIVIAIILAATTGLAGAAAIGAGIAWRIAHAPSESDGADATAPPEAAAVASVRTAAVTAGPLPRHLRLFGQVIALDGASQVLVAPIDGAVLRVPALPGAVVTAGATLVELAPGPDAREQLAEAEQAQTSAVADRERVRQRLALQLATAQDDALAQQALDLAKLRLTNLQARLPNGGMVAATIGGTISAVLVKPGQTVTAGTPLVEITPPGAREVRLGCSTADARGLTTEMTVIIAPVRPPDAATESWNGLIRQIAQRIDPDTHLVPVAVTIPVDLTSSIGESVTGEITVAGANGLVVPEVALVAGDDGWSIYTVTGGHARRHAVTVLTEDGTHAAVAERDEGADAADDATSAAPAVGVAVPKHPSTAPAVLPSPVPDAALATGDRVVVVGNQQLTDGMAVTEEAGQ